jgi:hypothetical protein
MTNSQSKHLPESPLHPKRTQEIATILCLLLGGEIELPRKIIGHLKEAETERDRAYHMSLIRPHHLIEGIKSVNEESIEMADECNWVCKDVEPEPSQTLYIIGIATSIRIRDNLCKRGMSIYEADCVINPINTGVLYPHWHINSPWLCYDQSPLAEMTDWLWYDQDDIEAGISPRPWL